MKNYSFWFKAAIFMQIITGVFHVIGIISERKPKNDEEKTLFDLMENYTFDMGAGFIRSMGDIMLSFSITFALLLFFSGVLNFYVLKNISDIKVHKGIIAVNIGTYIICFVTMVVLTFLPPVICTGLILLFLTISYMVAGTSKN
jgi:hypothetical protein